MPQTDLRVHVATSRGGHLEGALKRVEQISAAVRAETPVRIYHRIAAIPFTGVERSERG